MLRVAKWTAVVLAASLLAVGCSKSDAAGRSLPVEGGTVQLSDTVTVVVPAGAVEKGTRLELAGEASGPDGAGDLVDASTFVEINVVAGAVTAPVTVEFSGLAPGPDGGDAPVVGLHQRSDGTWESLPASYDAARQVASVQTPGFSPLGIVRPALDKVKALAAGLVAGFTSGVFAGTPQPTCADEAAARADGWQITSSDGDRVKWCFGMEGGARVVKALNASRYPRLFTVTGAERVDQPPGSWAASVSEAVSQMAGVNNEYGVERGETITVSPTSASSKRTVIASSYDGLSAALFQLQFGFDLASSFVTKFGLTKDNDPEKTAKAALGAINSSRGCLETLGPIVATTTFSAASTGAVLKDCVVPVVTTVYSGLAGAVLGATVGTLATAAVWALSGFDYLTDIGSDTYTITVSAPRPTGPVCDASLMWDAARTKLGYDPNDPAYDEVRRYGQGPGVYGERCYGEWAIGEISRPNTGLTDAYDVFHWVDGGWTYVGSPGIPPSSCSLAKLGMPPATVDKVLPPDQRVAQIERSECGAPAGAKFVCRSTPGPNGVSTDVTTLVGLWSQVMGQQDIYADHPQFMTLGRPALQQLVDECGKAYADQVANEITGRTFRAMEALLATM